MTSKRLQSGDAMVTAKREKWAQTEARWRCAAFGEIPRGQSAPRITSSGANEREVSLCLFEVRGSVLFLVHFNPVAVRVLEINLADAIGADVDLAVAVEISIGNV